MSNFPSLLKKTFVIFSIPYPKRLGSISTDFRILTLMASGENYHSPLMKKKTHYANLWNPLPSQPN